MAAIEQPVKNLVEEEALHSYSLRPNMAQKFRSADVKELIHGILISKLADKT